MPFWQFFRNRLNGWIGHALLVCKPSKTVHRIFFLCYSLLFIYFFEYETIVRSFASLLVFRSRSKQCEITSLLYSGSLVFRCKNLFFSKGVSFFCWFSKFSYDIKVSQIQLEVWLWSQLQKLHAGLKWPESDQICIHICQFPKKFKHFNF